MEKEWADVLNERFSPRPGWNQFFNYQIDGTAFTTSEKSLYFSNVTPKHNDSDVEEHYSFVEFKRPIYVCSEFPERDIENLDEHGNPPPQKVVWTYHVPCYNSGQKTIGPYPTYLEAMKAAEGEFPELFKEEVPVSTVDVDAIVWQIARGIYP